MKKWVSFGFVLLALLSCLSACTFTQKMSGALADEAESTSKVEEMMVALAEDRASDAKTLMHPQAVEKADTAIAQMSAYLAGRKVNSMELKSINVNTTTSSAGKARQEQMTYQVTLTDGVVIHLKVDYLSNNNGSGFTSFQLVIGVV